MLLQWRTEQSLVLAFKDKLLDTSARVADFAESLSPEEGADGGAEDKGQSKQEGPKKNMSPERPSADGAEPQADEAGPAAAQAQPQRAVLDNEQAQQQAADLAGAHPQGARAAPGGDQVQPERALFNHGVDAGLLQHSSELHCNQRQHGEQQQGAIFCPKPALEHAQTRNKQYSLCAQTISCTVALCSAWVQNMYNDTCTGRQHASQRITAHR